MKSTGKLLLCIPVFFLISCATSQDTLKEENWSPELRLQAGINHGGIVETTDLTSVEQVDVDGYTGATDPGFHAGAHVQLPLRKNSIETGLDYMYNSQSFQFEDGLQQFRGSRKIGVSQLMMPLTYNIGFLQSHAEGGLFRVKLGLLFQYNILQISDRGNQLPEFSFNHFSNGVTLGIESTPFSLQNGARIGFYLDIYRGSQIYKDYYNQSSFEEPGSSFFKAGMIYHFKY